MKHLLGDNLFSSNIFVRQFLQAFVSNMTLQPIFSAASLLYMFCIAVFPLRSEFPHCNTVTEKKHFILDFAPGYFLPKVHVNAEQKLRLLAYANVHMCKFIDLCILLCSRGLSDQSTQVHLLKM